MEIQVNGGTVAQKVDFGYGFFTVFQKDEMIDIIGVMKSKGCVNFFIVNVDQKNEIRVQSWPYYTKVIII